MTADERSREEQIAETEQIPDISAIPAWQALPRHHDQIRDKHIRELFDEDPARGTELALTVGDMYIDYSKHRITRETLTLLVDLARAAHLEQRRDAMYSGVHINTSEDRAVLHTALRQPRGVRADRGRPGRRHRRARGARPDGRVHRQAAQRRVDRCDGRADRMRGQHRYRWFRPRPGDGVRGVAPLRRRGHRVPVRIQRRPRRPGGQARRTRPGHNAFHRRIEDVLHAGDVDERDRGAALADRDARRCGGGQALRRGVDEQETGRRLRHQHRQHVRLLGLGRRPLLGRLGDRAVGDGGDRQGAVRRVPRRLPHRRRALQNRAAGGECACAAWPHRPLVQQLLRRAVAGGAAVLERHVAFRRLSAAADDGVQRQVRARRRCHR